MIRVYDEAGNVIETHEHAGDFREWVTPLCATLSSMRIVKLSLTIAAAVFALIAAALWYKSSVVSVELDPNNFGSTIMVDDEGKQTDFIAYCTGPGVLE